MKDFYLLVSMCIVVANGVHVSNLNMSCFNCLCHLYGCELARGCSSGYCGPFYISRIYWADAGKPTMPDDEPDRRESFQDCVRNYDCAVRTIENYMAKYGQDCNHDGVTDCFDYMMINYNGGNDCSTPLLVTPRGRQLLVRYKDCRF